MTRSRASLSLMHPRGPIRRVGAWLALLVVAFNLAGGLVMPASAVSLGETVICTAAGMMVLPAAGDQQVPAAEAAGPCVFCLPLLHGGAIAPGGVSIGPGALPAVAVTPDFIRDLPPYRASGLAAPRAPPAIPV
ncbi:DUF2946 family protein [Magnetospirillum sp. UT-4]|uniref:DUF2946 family protein n=1 Tax=Magnetospirillum sp. UT-4 TaxID=2681467 RepID=UPI001574B223|nr:DUF2946 family protein [Magnetospirillum sp. UT-4]